MSAAQPRSRIGNKKNVAYKCGKEQRAEGKATKRSMQVSLLPFTQITRKRLTSHQKSNQVKLDVIKHKKRTNQRSDNEVKGAAREIKIKKLRHVIVELCLHSAVSRLTLFKSCLFTQRHFASSPPPPALHQYCYCYCHYQGVGSSFFVLQLRTKMKETLYLLVRGSRLVVGFCTFFISMKL